MPIRPAINSLALLALTLLLSAPALALPDAHLRTISAEGADFRPGDPVPLNIEIRNAGDSPLPSLPVTLTIDYQPYAEWKTPPDLPPGESATWSLTWTATQGSFPFHATVDPFNELIESDETNNTTFINIGAADSPRSSPWPALLAGILSLSLAFTLAFLLSSIWLTRRRAKKRPSRFAPGPPSDSPPGNA